jgi:diguanylate cyclase (GGDEF)-like protein
VTNFQLLDHITDGVMALDREWKFRNINRTAAWLLKRRPEDLLGREIWTEYPDLIGSRYEAAYRRAAETCMPSAATDFYAPLDSWFEVRAFPCDDGIVVLIRDVTEARAISELLSRQATHDELTGLINRRELLLRLNNLVDEGAAASVDQLFIDLDRFKDINDSFGHAVGDEVLRVIGERVSDMVTESEHVSRIGGDEFVIFLVDAPEGEAARVARDVTIRMREPIQTPCVRASVGASIGSARYPISASNACELLRMRTARCITPSAQAVRMCVRLEKRSATGPHQRNRLRCRAGMFHWQAGLGSAHRSIRRDPVWAGWSFVVARRGMRMTTTRGGSPRRPRRLGLGSPRYHRSLLFV